VYLSVKVLIFIDVNRNQWKLMQVNESARSSGWLKLTLG